MEIKPATTFEEQVNIMARHGLIIEDRAKAIQILSRTNYYTLSGYLHAFKNKDGEFGCDITFDTMYNIYQCDKRFKNIILYALDEIEQNLKTKIAYSLAHAIGAIGYLDANNFRDEQEHKKFLLKFNKAVYRNQKLPFVKHHIFKYNGKFPIWVAVNLFTMGMIKHFYKNLNTPYQKQIAKHFNTGIRQLSSWIDSAVYLRNLAAHYMRLYNFKIQFTPLKNRHDLLSPTYKIFDIVYIMKYLILDKREWNVYILPVIEQIFDEYKGSITLSAYGFPNNWIELLHI